MATPSQPSPELYVRQDIGKGRPMVLLHGMFGDGSQWQSIAELLAKNFRVIVVDLLGHGKSPRPPQAKYTPEEHSQALRTTLRKLGATEQATLAGYSMGGTVAMQYAADYQDVVQLYLISTPFYLQPEDMVAAGYANSLAYTKLSVGLFKLVDKLLHPGKLLDKASRSDFLMHAMQSVVHAYDNKLDAEIARLNLAELVTNYPFMQVLSKVTAPISFFCGTRDVFVVHSQLQALKKIQPLMDIQSLPIVKNDHMLVQLLPKKMATVLSQYAQRELHVEHNVGSGETIVLLHGIESASSYWNNVVPDLSQNYHVVTIDLLGFGKSPKPMNIAYTLDEQVAWLKRTLAMHKITKFHLVGHSLGALIALVYAEEFATNISSLSLISPVFFASGRTQKFIVKRLHFAHYFSDSSYLARVISQAVGSERIRPFVPTIRSVENGVAEQKAFRQLRNLTHIPTTIVYGAKDPLIDEPTLNEITTMLPSSHVTKLQNQGHNPSLAQPQQLLQKLPFVLPDKLHAKRSTVKTKSFFKQLVALAFPILIVKGLAYITVGLLLFSRYRAEVLVVSVAVTVMYQGLQLVRGSFSLRNEGLFYLGHVLIGASAIGVGIVLHKNFNLSLTLAVLACSGYVLVNGLTRLIAGYFWTTRTALKHRQIIIGWLLFITGTGAMFGSVFSVHLIAYGIAAYALTRGTIYIGYALFTVVLAYVRGFQH